MGRAILGNALSETRGVRRRATLSSVLAPPIPRSLIPRSIIPERLLHRLCLNADLNAVERQAIYPIHKGLSRKLGQVVAGETKLTEQSFNF